MNDIATSRRDHRQVPRGQPSRDNRQAPVLGRAVRRGPGVGALPCGVRRARAEPQARRAARRAPRRGRSAAQHERQLHVGRHGRADDRGDGLGGAEAALPAAGLRVRRDLVPAVLRARRGLGSRVAVDESRTRRRRVGVQRPEGVDDARARRRLGDGARPHEPRPAEAQGPHLLPHRHAISPASR